jgi:hypothetical protein
MKKNNKFFFLKPQLLNVLPTVIVLCLPILREQYNNGQYIAYYRPIAVIIDYFLHFQFVQQPHLLLVMAIFILVIYFTMSLLVFGGSKLLQQIIKKK